MTADLDKRLKDAVTNRDRLAAEVQRIAGRKEAAQKTLASVEQEIRAKNLDPSTLDETVTKLESALQDEVVKLEEGLRAAETALSPYLESKSP